MLEKFTGNSFFSLILFGNANKTVLETGRVNHIPPKTPYFDIQFPISRPCKGLKPCAALAQTLRCPFPNTAG